VGGGGWKTGALREEKDGEVARTKTGRWGSRSRTAITRCVFLTAVETVLEKLDKACSPNLSLSKYPMEIVPITPISKPVSSCQQRAAQFPKISV
jgi:hypothetical protein